MQADDPVIADVAVALQELHGGPGEWPEFPIDGQQGCRRGEQAPRLVESLLQVGHQGAARTWLQGRGQSVSRRLREQRRPRNRTDDPVDGQPELSLEVLDRGRRLRAEVAVDADRYTIDPEQELRVGDGAAAGTRRDGGGRAGRLRERHGFPPVVAEASGTAGLAWDERNRVRRDTAGRDSRVTAGFSALEAVQDGAANPAGG